MPVNWAISPARAFLYKPFGFRASQTESGVLTYTSLKFCEPRISLAMARYALEGEINEAIMINTATFIKRATSAERRIFSVRSSVENPKLRFKLLRKLSPSSTKQAHPRSISSRSKANASVDFPDALKPVSQMVIGYLFNIL